MRLLLTALVLHNSFFFSPTYANTKSSRKPASEPSSKNLESRAIKELDPLTGKRLTVSEFLARIQSKTPINQLNLIRDKSVRIKEGTFWIEKSGSQDFIIKTESSQVRVTLEDYEKGIFKLNGRTHTLSIKSKPEVLWKEISQALSLSSKTSLFQVLFIEEAQANWMGLLLGVALVGLIGYMYNQSNCSQYDAYAAQCDLATASPGSVNTADLYYNARSFDESWFNLSLGCSGSKEKVRSCIPRIGGQINSSSTGATVQ